MSTKATNISKASLQAEIASQAQIIDAYVQQLARVRRDKNATDDLNLALVNSRSEALAEVESLGKERTRLQRLVVDQQTTIADASKDAHADRKNFQRIRDGLNDDLRALGKRHKELWNTIVVVLPLCTVAGLALGYALA